MNRTKVLQLDFLMLVVALVAWAKLFQAANEPKRFVTIHNAGHNNWLTDAYLKQLNDFIRRIAVASE